MIILAVVVGVATFLYLYKEKVDRSVEAVFYYCDMGDRFDEMRDDPFMSAEKWKEWLPLFEDADDRFAQTHPYIENPLRYSDLVRQEIENL